MTKPKRNKHRVVVEIEPALHQQLLEYSKATCQTKTTSVARALEIFLNSKTAAEEMKFIRAIREMETQP